MPTIMTICPYLFENTCWVFDDERAGLKEEAFVLGMTEMISRLIKAKSIPAASKGFSLSFAAEPFDHDVELSWLSPEAVATECFLVKLSVGALISPDDRRVGNQPGWRLNHHDNHYDWQVPSATPMGSSGVVFGFFRGFEPVGAWVGFDSMSVGSGDGAD